jgi:undecaprenyl diphosphate synthase
VGFYDHYLSFCVRSSTQEPPKHIVLIITERDLLIQHAYVTLEKLFKWAFDYGAEVVSVYVSVLDSAIVPTLNRELSLIQTSKKVTICQPSNFSRAETPIRIGIGLGGKYEFTEAVKSICSNVQDGHIRPDEITNSTIEEQLVFPAEPDLVIKTGGEYLSDFMIWQSVYSELYFTDINWRDFRKRDYLRALLDYDSRKRRFGT